MQVLIAGTGKLATELLQQLQSTNECQIAPWRADLAEEARAIVVHAGSGREIDSIASFCERTSSVLVELATGSALEERTPSFPVVMCPNTNILMLKFLCMLERSGALFKGSDIRIIESHQSTKTSVPGTAVSMADSLGLSAAEITSMRNTSQQAAEFGIPQEHLARHAFHRIEIQDGPCAIAMETRVYGESPYANGVQQIITAIGQRVLQARTYSINEFIENGWV
jgi:4-hydroxy-tetrahydrodipicolinate reductase